MLADGAPQQRQHALHDLAKRKPFRPERLPASESEKLLGEMRAALGRLKSAGGEAPLVRVGQLLGQHLGVADHDGEQVVEIVRHAAGELAHRFHLLSLAQALLQGRAL